MTGLVSGFAHPRSPAATIGSDAEAVAAAHRVAEGLAEGAIDRDRDQMVPIAEMNALSEAGLLGITVPAAHGGADVSFETVAEVFRILSAADPAIGQVPQNHFVCVNVVRECGTPEQQRFFFAELLRGARFGNAQAERGTSSVLDIATGVYREGRTYRLRGTKYYCTGALMSDWIPVAALDESDRTVYAFVPRKAPGVEVLQDWDPIGQRVTFSGTVRFDNVALAPDQIVAPWPKGAATTLHHAFLTLMHGAIDVGIARNAWTDTLAALRARKRPRHGARVTLAQEDPYVLADLGQGVARLHALEALLAHAGRALDVARWEGTESTFEAALVAASGAKALAEDVAIEAASQLFALTGSASINRDLGFDRHWRNARTHTVHDANQWRYRTVGDWTVNAAAPAPLVRRRAK
jgi:SfnB family sulfur acquisition oxidoreductase